MCSAGRIIIGYTDLASEGSCELIRIIVIRILQKQGDGIERVRDHSGETIDHIFSDQGNLMGVLAIYASF